MCCRFMKEELLAQVLEALLAIRGLVVQKTKLIGDCGRFLGELLDSFLQESYENKAHFIRACISGLQVHCRDKKGRTPVVQCTASTLRAIKKFWCCDLYVKSVGFCYIFWVVVHLLNFSVSSVQLTFMCCVCAVYIGAAVYYHMPNEARACVHDDADQGPYTGRVHQRVNDKKSLF